MGCEIFYLLFCHLFLLLSSFVFVFILVIRGLVIIVHIYLNLRNDAGDSKLFMAYDAY